MFHITRFPRSYFNSVIKNSGCYGNKLPEKGCLATIICSLRHLSLDRFNKIYACTKFMSFPQKASCLATVAR